MPRDNYLLYMSFQLGRLQHVKETGACASSVTFRQLHPHMMNCNAHFKSHQKATGLEFLSV